MALSFGSVIFIYYLCYINLNTNKMKQTAIDFLESEFNKWAEGRLFIPQHIIEQAKEMEKEQIIEAWDNGYDKGTRDRIEKISNPVGNAEQYYNETFKSE